MNRSLTIAMMLTFACTTPDEITEPAQTDENAPEQLPTSDGKGDGAAVSKDPRLLWCNLAYARYEPFATRPIGGFSATFGQVENEGMSAGDAKYAINVVTNKQPPFNLSFIASIVDLATFKEVAYIVLPRPHVGGAYLFELGGQIPPVTLEPGGTVFDYTRAYCSIRMP